MILPRSRFLFSRSAVLVLACLWVADGFAQAMAAQVSPVSPVAFGQDGKRITLLRALEDLKARHHISLLFERKNVEGKTVDPAAYESAASADEALTQLLKDTGLQHEKIEETVFVVRTQREKKARDGQKNRLKTGAVSPDRSDGPRLPGAATPDSAAGPAEARAEVTVSGTVQSDKDEPLPGVSVVVKGTQNGTVTDNEGKYRLTVPDGAAVLVFSFIGYVTEEVPVGNGSIIDVRLLSDVKTLSEVVVVGYGTQERREVTGSIASVKAAELERNINADVTTALQGRAAGVQITQAGGTPGGAVRVRIRGTASILSSGEPLYVIDGIPATLGAFGLPGVARNPLSEINPNDIELVEVLKDASAAAIYGSRAANGVILITTKKGK